jgi:hypothetical protein
MPSIIFVWLCLFTWDLYAQDEQSIPTKGSQLLLPQYSKPITPAQVNASGDGYSINTSGYYFLTEDFKFYPQETAEYTSAIRINTSNVILDLNGKTISHKNSKTGDVFYFSNSQGITVGATAKNVTIKNGCINYITGNGIEIQANCSNITLENITILNCAQYGIVADGDEESSAVTNLTLKDCTVSQCSGTLAGPEYFYGNGNAIGIYLNYVINSTIINTESSHNQINITENSNSEFNALGIGLYINRSHCIKIQDCAFHNNKGPLACGVYISRSSNIECIHCQAHENSTTVKPLEDTNIATTAAGFLISGSSSCTFAQCKANRNIAHGDGDFSSASKAAGFYLDGSIVNTSANYNSFTDCSASENATTGSASEAGSLCAGFLSSGKGVENLPEYYNRGNVFIRCLASANDSTSNIAAGIALIFETGSIIQQCRCIGNGNIVSANTTDATYSYEADGYVVETTLPDTTHPTTIGCGIYLGPQGIFDNGVNIYESGRYTFTKNIIITECWLCFNTWYGLFDHGKDCQSLIMKNIAFRNGTQNKTYSEGNIDTFSKNYYTQYLQSNEKLEINSATVGGFGALNVANPFGNIEWQVAGDNPLLPQ